MRRNNLMTELSAEAIAPVNVALTNTHSHDTQLWYSLALYHVLYITNDFCSFEESKCCTRVGYALTGASRSLPCCCLIQWVVTIPTPDVWSEVTSSPRTGSGAAARSSQQQLHSTRRSPNAH